MITFKDTDLREALRRKYANTKDHGVLCYAALQSKEPHDPQDIRFSYEW